MCIGETAISFRTRRIFPAWQILIRQLLCRSIPALLCIVSLGHAAFYVSSENGSENGDGSINSPWSSLSAVSRYSFSPGETVYFERGSSWNGSFEITASGTPERPIVYTSYGAGKRPAISNTDASTYDGNAIRVSANHIVIDDFYIHDCANSKPRRVGGIVSLDRQNHHITVRNCRFSGCRVAVRMYAHDVLITKNYMHSPGGTINKWWGPMGIVGCSYNVEISHNRIEGFLAKNNYGYDGGAIEIDDKGPKYNWKIHHNITRGNEGFLESIDADECPSCTFSDLQFYCNYSDDYQWWIDGPIGRNPVIENNTVLRVRPANTQWNLCLSLHHAIPDASVRNNIFVLANGVTAFDEEVPGNHNVYYSVDGSVDNPKGYPLGPGEIIADPQFVDYENRNVRLRPTSPAVDMGQSVLYKTDLEGKMVPQGAAPDAGAYEYPAEKHAS